MDQAKNVETERFFDGLQHQLRRKITVQADKLAAEFKSNVLKEGEGNIKKAISEMILIERSNLILLLKQDETENIKTRCGSPVDSRPSHMQLQNRQN